MIPEVLMCGVYMFSMFVWVISHIPNYMLDSLQVLEDQTQEDQTQEDQTHEDQALENKPQEDPEGTKRTLPEV